jgi:hypothetical protein
MHKRSKPISFSAQAEAIAHQKNRENSHERAVRELPAQWLSTLPESIQLWLDVPGAPAQVCLFSGEHDPDAPEHVLADTIVFDGAELNALVCAVEADRIWHGDFLGLCFEKWRQPQHRVEAQALLAGANPENGESAIWSVERVLRRLGARLQHVEFGAAPRVKPLHVAA